MSSLLLYLRLGRQPIHKMPDSPNGMAAPLHGDITGVRFPHRVLVYCDAAIILPNLEIIDLSEVIVRSTNSL